MLAERHETDRRLADDEGGGRSLEAEGAGRRRDRLRRRRAGLPDAGAHRRRGARGDRRELHEVHDQLRHRGAEARRSARATRPTTASTTRRPKSIITAGGKQALYNAALVLFGAGDEVITHAPGWPTLVEQIKLADATPVIVHTHAEDGFTRARRADPRGHHAAHPRHHHQLARQPDRRADVGSGDGAPSPTRRRGADIWVVARSLLREADLRRDAAQPAGGAVRAHCAIARCSAARRRRPTR